MDIEKEIEEIKERNRRVEMEKGWETSYFRIVSITVITYVLATIVLYLIGIERPYINSLIPTIGFMLSTLSLPFIKKFWIRKNLKK